MQELDKRGAGELLETEQKFMDDKVSKGNGPAKTEVDLDNCMPHNLDEQESP